MNTKSTILTAEEWLERELTADESEIIIGSPSQPIIRPRTKNIILASEKAFKTTTVLRLTLGMSCGRTVIPQLPVIRPRRVLYIHGELSPPEIRERTQAAAQGLPRPLDNFYQGRDLDIHLGKEDGQKALKRLLETYRPEDLVLDPLQAFITGFDENEFQSMSLVTHFIDKMIDEFKATVYIVAHTGKDRSKGTRGHSSIAGWRDTEIVLERRERKDLVTLKVDPRWAAPLEPFDLKFEGGTVWPTVEHVLASQAEEILQFVLSQGGSTTKKAVAEHFKLKHDAARKAIQRAMKAGVIEVDKNNVKVSGSNWSESSSDTGMNGQPHKVGDCPSDSTLHCTDIPELVSKA